MTATIRFVVTGFSRFFQPAEAGHNEQQDLRRRELFGDESPGGFPLLGGLIEVDGHRLDVGGRLNAVLRGGVFA